MGVLSIAQIQQLWVSAGGTPQSAAMASAIAMAESGGNPDAYNAHDPYGGSYGLWQINGSHAPGGDSRSESALSSDWAQQIVDPLSNATEAVGISANGGDWFPWGTYTSGAYRQYLNQAVAVQSAGSLANVGPIATGTEASQIEIPGSGSGTATAQPVGLFSALNPLTWLKYVGWFALGLTGTALFVIGMILMARMWNGSTTTAVGGAVGKVASVPGKALGGG